MKITTLITSMNQNDVSLFKKMNIQTDAIIANQTTENRIEIHTINQKEVQVVSTKTRGLSRNRNIGLVHLSQTCDVVVFADDDLVFVDGYDEIISTEFEKHPYAEAIKFNLHDLSSKRKISMKRIEKFEKATRRNMSSSGVWGCAVKTDAIKRHNLFFNEEFGTGTKNYCGEDTIFLQEMISKGIRFYRSPRDIAGIDQTESSWFTGYDEKFFSVCGMVLACCFPRLCRLLSIRSSLKFAHNKRCDINFRKILKSYLIGIKEYKKNH